MSIFDTVVGAVGLGLSAYGKYKQGEDAKDAADDAAYQRMLEASAQKKSYKLELKRHEQDTRRLIGQQKVRMAASGAGFTGTSTDILRDTMNRAELDAEIIKKGGEARVTQQISSADAYKKEGSSIRSGSLWDAGSTLLTGAAKLDWSSLF